MKDKDKEMARRGRLARKRLEKLEIKALVWGAYHGQLPLGLVEACKAADAEVTSLMLKGF